jgi:hypothetical protein
MRVFQLSFVHAGKKRPALDARRQEKFKLKPGRLSYLNSTGESRSQSPRFADMARRVKPIFLGGDAQLLAK